MRKTSLCNCDPVILVRLYSTKMKTMSPERITLPDHIELEVGFNDHSSAIDHTSKDQTVFNILYVV